jgi:chemotaxis receptor (MCP) glutamine deamidase CheD
MILEMEDIPIIEEDMGGKFTRKVIMDVKSGMVYLKKTLNPNHAIQQTG